MVKALTDTNPGAPDPGDAVDSAGSKSAASAKYAHTEDLVRSKQRVADHGEVFTPAWMVEAMLDLVKSESVFAFRRYEDASLRYTGIDSHPGLAHYGLYDTVVARDHSVTGE